MFINQWINKQTKLSEIDYILLKGSEYREPEKVQYSGDGVYKWTGKTAKAGFTKKFTITR